MLFNSPEFLFIFLPAMLLAFEFARRLGERLALATLVVGSLVFYSWLSARYTPFLLMGIAVNFFLGRALQRQPSKALLATAVALNLAPLLWIKYWHWIGGLLRIDAKPHELPLGISFVTFLQIAFLVEAFSGRLPKVTWLRYATFVTFFPHLIAGPILRFGEFEPQLARLGGRRVDHYERQCRALLLIVVGLFKKVVIADHIAAIVNPIFAHPAGVDLWAAWTAALGFSLELYFDFSGMCEIALVVSMLLGIDIPLNFYSPYRAMNISRFWRDGWHRTLGQFFRDFVYIPLGGNRHGLARALAALTVAMLLAGLWHGAAETFVLWGLFHGALLAGHKIWRQRGLSMRPAVAQALTLTAVVIGWVIFRAASLGDAAEIWAGMLGMHGVVLPDPVARALLAPTAGSSRLTGAELPVFVALLLACATMPNVHEWRLVPSRRWSALLATCSLVVAFSIGNVTEFWYWRW